MMIYTFGECVLDTQLHVLSRAEQPVKLRPKAFEVLVYLLEQRDRIVTKHELCEQVWTNQFISDATLGSTVRAVRRAIGDTNPTTSLSCADQICPRRIAAFRAQATKGSGVLRLRKPL
jgi:DNA-binding winged helix-turn-helix (wHTH) protein